MLPGLASPIASNTIVTALNHERRRELLFARHRLLESHAGHYVRMDKMDSDSLSKPSTTLLASRLAGEKLISAYHHR